MERRCSLVPFRLMQRPRARRTVSFAAAAELEVADESREEEDEKERGRMKRDCSTLFIRKRLTGGHEK